MTDTDYQLEALREQIGMVSEALHATRDALRAINDRLFILENEVLGK